MKVARPIVRSETMPPVREQFELFTLLDRADFGAFQALTMGLCALVAMLDGYDTQAIGFVAPLIIRAWGMPSIWFGPIFAIGTVGALVGGIVCGYLSDRYGRQRTILIAMLVMAAGAGLCATAHSITELSLYRILTGLGAGGAMPSVAALTTEYAPKRNRAAAITATFCGFPLGAVIGGMLSAHLMPNYGWQAVFLIGAALPVLLVSVLLFFLPESIGWLAVAGRRSDIARLLARMELESNWNGLIRVQVKSSSRASIGALFDPRKRWGTLLLWSVSFLSMLFAYLIVNWLPTIVVSSGATVSKGALAVAALNMSGIVGSLSVGRLMDRFGSVKVVGPAYMIGACLIFLLGISGSFATLPFFISAASGLFCLGGYQGTLAISAQFYDLEYRSTGIAWSLGAGRLGAIVGPVLGGFLINDGGNDQLLIFTLAGIALCAGLGTVGLGLHLGHREDRTAPFAVLTSEGL